jgi:hypothetical protein
MFQDLQCELRGSKKRFGCLLIISMLGICLSCGRNGRSVAQRDLDVKHGGTPVIDGVFSSGEWSDANSIQISVEQGWTVQVSYKHDNSALYIAFSNLINKGKKLYPELLLDTTNGKTAAWNSDDWWFHASFNDCEGHGDYSVYTFGDKGSCQKDHVGWKANNYPLNSGGIIEIMIPYAKVGLVHSNGKTVGMAFDVTDATSKWYFWPAGAKLENPSTWGVAASSDEWK